MDLSQIELKQSYVWSSSLLLANLSALFSFLNTQQFKGKHSKPHKQNKDTFKKKLTLEQLFNSYFSNLLVL